MSLDIQGTKQAIKAFESGIINIRRLMGEHADEIGCLVTKKLIGFVVAKEVFGKIHIAGREYPEVRRSYYLATPEGFEQYKKTHRRKDGNSKPKIMRVYN